MDGTKDSLTDTLIREIMIMFGMPNRAGLKKAFNTLFNKAASKLSDIGLNFDRLVMEYGFPRAAQWALSRWCKEPLVRGAENIPTEGPVLVVSNHPGTYDGLVLISQLPRPDVHLIASSIPFFKALPNAEKYLVFVNRDDPHQRMTGARQAIRRLQDGRLVLLYGSGTIDPDPSVYPDAEKNIDMWYPSIELFPRLVPEVKVLLSMVSHVVSPKWADHFITHLRNKIVEKRRLAELGQLVQQLMFPGSLYLSPRISFSKPVDFSELQKESPDGRPFSALIARGKKLLEEHCSAFGNALAQANRLEHGS